ncbi:CmcI family methyltransferase [Cytobacillus firmus]|uniref:CmcI family methyltransferase n=1 Tax=Cytobacillus firmus TaxID=1399 RepID=UPI0018CE1975|nr:CmcI family methyltransferase [Cytobacillus firmus]MBG9588632.1 cephalosporin hydroxylase [Cytobacillus firmus]
MDIIQSFHKHYYDSFIWKDTSWLGIKSQKCPLDLWTIQEIIFETKPDWIIECGTNAGGSSLFYATICDSIRKGNVITIDINDLGKAKPKHPRITYLIGSSTSSEIENKIREKIKTEHSVMVILDSDHSKKNVLNELKIYQSFVTKNNYLIVEDTNINGNPVFPEFGEGPMEALEEFLSKNDKFIIDRNREKFFLTFNPKGYLKKLKE